ERAAAAEAPQRVDAAAAGERELGGVVPDRTDRPRPHRAADVRGLQRRATLDRAVRLDAHHEPAGLAAAPVVGVGGVNRSELGLLGAEVAEVVAGGEHDAVGARAELL